MDKIEQILKEPYNRTRKEDIELLYLLKTILYELTLDTIDYSRNIPIELDLQGYNHVNEEASLILEKLIKPCLNEIKIDSKRLINKYTGEE